MSAEATTRYFVTIGEETTEVEVREGSLVLDGESLAADISTLPASDRQHLRVDGRSLSLFARRGETGWAVELEGRLFNVVVEDERTRHIRELASHVAPVETRRELRAPMPGLIVRLEVGEGDQVSAGDGLVVMEAMKMENELRADTAGRVASIEVKEGQAVERDEVLLRLEQVTHVE
jgi:pyruvate carboxylase subunit B